MAAQTLGLLANPFFTNVILPFLLIFTVIFAILQKTKLFEGKKGIDIIVALVIGLIFVGVQSVVGFTLKLLPITAALIVVLLSIYLVFGFIGVHQSKALQIALGIVFGIALIVVLLWATGTMPRTSGIRLSEQAIAYIVFFLALGGAIAVAVTSKSKSESEK